MLLIDAFAAYQNVAFPETESPQDMRPGDISDLYIHEGERMRFRVPGGLLEFGDPVDRQRFVDTFSLAIPRFEERMAQKGRLEDSYDCPVARIRQSSNGIEGGFETHLDQIQIRVRMTVYQHSQGRKYAAVVRFGSDKAPALQDLGLEPMARSLMEELRGGVLVTGAAHAGKTFTMTAMMDHIAHSADGHLVTIEDPIELPLRPDRCVVSQQEVGSDVQSFDSGVIGSLRQSPIALMVGEIRDSATAHAAIRVLQSGHFLVAGIHAADAAEATGTFSALLEPARRDDERAQLSRRLSGVIHQVLVPSIDARNWCVACEVISFRSNPALRSKLAAGDFEGLKAAVRNEEAGTFHLNRSLLRLVVDGRIKPGDAFVASYDQAQLKQMLQRAGLEQE